MIRVVLPYHLRTLAGIDGEVSLEVKAPVCVASILDALETRYPVVKGTIRDTRTLVRRPFIRFYACKEDWSNEDPALELPSAIASGAEPFMVIGAIAGG